MSIDWKRVLIDAAIVFGLTFIAGFVIGFVAAVLGGAAPPALIGLSDMLFVIVGFAYVAYRTNGRRFQHLALVALGVWLFSIINPLLGIISLPAWIFAIVPTFIFMFIGAGVGIGLRHLFHKEEKLAGGV